MTIALMCSLRCYSCPGGERLCAGQAAAGVLGQPIRG